MTALIEAQGLSKAYGAKPVLQGCSFQVQPGRIVGLIGRNGAGKTTLLKALLGLTPCSGSLSVLGRNPALQRDALMQDVAFIADTAVLPRWLRTRQALDYVAAVHPRFDRAVAERFLAGTQVPLTAKVGTLSKGMVTQLHLALVLAIRAPLLVLDEPTLGLDLPSRRAFYDTLLNDYMDGERTILVTTHQVEEIEHVLTDLLFIEQGRIVLDAPVESLGERFIQVQVAAAQVDAARALQPLHERVVFGRTVMLFDGVPAATLAVLGDCGRPSVADLFLAKLDGQAEPAGRAA